MPYDESESAYMHIAVPLRRILERNHIDYLDQDVSEPESPQVQCNSHQHRSVRADQVSMRAEQEHIPVTRPQSCTRNIFLCSWTDVSSGFAAVNQRCGPKGSCSDGCLSRVDGLVESPGETVANPTRCPSSHDVPKPVRRNTISGCTHMTR